MNLLLKITSYLTIGELFCPITLEGYSFILVNLGFYKSYYFKGFATRSPLGRTLSFSQKLTLLFFLVLNLFTCFSFLPVVLSWISTDESLRNQHVAEIWDAWLQIFSWSLTFAHDYISFQQRYPFKAFLTILFSGCCYPRHFGSIMTTALSKYKSQ